MQICFYRLEDLGEGRTRVHFRETYHAFNPVMRLLFEARVHRAISRSNDDTLASMINAGLEMLRSQSRPTPSVQPGAAPDATPSPE